MVHCSDVGNRLSEFCSTKVHRKAETGKNIPRKSRFVIVGRNIFESHFLFRFLPNINPTCSLCQCNFLILKYRFLKFLLSVPHKFSRSVLSADS